MIFSVPNSLYLTIHPHPAPRCHWECCASLEGFTVTFALFPLRQQRSDWGYRGIYPLFHVFYVALHQMGYSHPGLLARPLLEWENIFLCPWKTLMGITVLRVFPPPCTWRNLLSLLLLLLLVLMQLIILSFPRENAEGLGSGWVEVPDHVDRLLNVSLGRLSSRSWALVSVWILTQGAEGKPTHLLPFWVRSSGLEEVHLAEPSPLGFIIQRPHQPFKKKPKAFSWMFVLWAVRRRSHTVMAQASFAGCKLSFGFSTHGPWVHAQL